jgi:hypothetical protein
LLAGSIGCPASLLEPVDVGRVRTADCLNAPSRLPPPAVLNDQSLKSTRLSDPWSELDSDGPFEALAFVASQARGAVFDEAAVLPSQRSPRQLDCGRANYI